MNSFIAFLDTTLSRIKFIRDRSIRRYKKILDKNLESRRLDFHDSKGQSLLHLALLCGRDDAYDQLLANNLDPHEESQYGMTPAELRSYLQKNSLNTGMDVLTFRDDRKEESRLLTPCQILRKFNFQISDQLRFQDSGIMNWCMTRLHKIMELPYIRKESLWVKTLFEEPFLNKRHPKIEVRFIDRLIGYGIFANEEIKELTYIGEYTGVVRPRTHKKDLLNEYTFSFTLASFDTSFVIDAKSEGNFVRLINHSDTPNCSARWLVCKGISHVIIFANRFIPKGTQLTYEYGPHFWKHRTTPSEL